MTYQITKTQQTSILRPTQLRDMLQRGEFVKDLDAHINRFLSEYNPLASSECTHKALSMRWGMFVSFCQAKGVQSLGADLNTIREYLLQRSNLNHRNTIKMDLWAINKVHKIVGLPLPKDDQFIADTMKEVQRKSVIVKDERIRQAQGASWEHLREVVSVLRDSDKVSDVRDALCLALGYAGLFRSNELLNIKIKHIQEYNGKVFVEVVHTKTNISGESQLVELPNFVVNLLNSYMDVRGEVNSDEEYLIVSTNRYNKTMRHKSPLSYNTLLNVFKNGYSLFIEMFPEMSDVVKEWTTHSTRVGGAQDLAKNDVSLTKIAVRGRWSSLKNPMQYAKGYIQSGDEMNDIMC